MAYRFNLTTSVETNVHHILDEQLDKALQQLTEDFKQKPADAIHDARKRFKKGRSLLRLVRKSMDKETYQQEKNCLRDIGRLLAPARDGEAYRETLDSLLENYASTLDLKAFSDLKEGLFDLQRIRLRQLIDRDEPMTSVISDLKDSRIRLQKLELTKTGWDAIRKNLKRIYRQGQERFETAYDEESDRAFHEWRKRVKDLWYDTRLLQSLWPSVMDAFESEAHQLSKYLGDDHDIAELRQQLLNSQNNLAVVHEKSIKVLLPLMAHRQSVLRQHARDLGLRLYSETPDAFIERLTSYWRAELSAQ